MLGKINGINPISNMTRIEETVRTKTVTGSDSISISSDAEKMSQLLALREKVAQAPEIRLDKVEEVMNQMKNPDYINDTVLSEVADRLMEIFKI